MIIIFQFIALCFSTGDNVIVLTGFSLNIQLVILAKANTALFNYPRPEGRGNE